MQRKKVVVRILLGGKLWIAVRYILEREEGGILDMHAINAKSGTPVVEVLQRKHLLERVPDTIDLEDHGDPPPAHIRHLQRNGRKSRTHLGQ